MYYTTYGKFQSLMKQHYERTGHRFQFPEMMHYMNSNGLTEPVRPTDSVPDDYDTISTAEFDALVDTLPLSWTDDPEGSHVIRNVNEDILFPLTRDVFLMRHPRYTRPLMHAHNYFEINYVVTGSLTFHFENEPKRLLHAGELTIIAPGSSHDCYTTDDHTFAYTICIRKSTFNTVFFQQLSGQDLLSYFFRTILQSDGRPNYLLFYTDRSSSIIRYLRTALLECSKSDEYSNAAVINLIQLLFIQVLRNYSKTVLFYNYEMGSDFTLVLQYIQHNYRKLTLSTLAGFFHYTEPYLCALIKKNTGHTFSELIRELKLADAVKLLTNTDMKIREIADTVGYNSADHFSRTFRDVFHCSPQQYRKDHHTDRFVPFSSEITSSEGK